MIHPPRHQSASTYYSYGYQAVQRYPFQWHGGQGGVLPSTKPAATTRELGNADLLESGYGDDNFIPYPAFRRTALHRPALGDTAEYGNPVGILAASRPTTTSKARARASTRPTLSPYVATGDWPLIRPAGPEPIDPNPVSGLIDDWNAMSTTTKVVVVAAVGGVAWLLLRKRR